MMEQEKLIEKQVETKRKTVEVIMEQIPQKNWKKGS